MADNNDDQQIERMLAAGKITADEAERLRDTLNDRAVREETLHTAGSAGERRRLWLLLSLVCLSFLLGAGSAFLLGIPVGGDEFVAATDTLPPAAAPVEGRLIDLSALSEERSTTMNRSVPLSLGVILITVLAVLAGMLVFFYNGLVGAREQVNSGWAQVENVYQRRLDLIPLLVDTVQTYTEHEHRTLTELTRARADAMRVRDAIGDTPRSAEQFKAIESSQGEVTAALARLFALVENYPDLKASRNFLSLQDQIEGTENRVAMERRNYNEFSRLYNTRLQTFPGNIVADMIGFEDKPYFEAETRALKGISDPFGRDDRAQ